MLISDNSSAEETEQYVYAEGGLEYAYSSDTEVEQFCIMLIEWWITFVLIEKHIILNNR